MESKAAHGHGQREVSNAASSVAAEGGAGLDSPTHTSDPLVERAEGSVCEQAGGRDPGVSTPNAVDAIREVAAFCTESSIKGLVLAKKQIFKVLNLPKNKVFCRNDISQNPTGSNKELSAKPHVNQQVIPFDNRAISHYSCELQKSCGETQTIPVNLWTLREHYSEFRPVLGDGECFYRSFLFSYLEQVLCMQDTHEEHRLLAAVNEVSLLHRNLGWTSEFPRSHKAFEKLVKKVESWRRKGIFISVPSANSYRKQKLLKFFSSYDETNIIFVFLRLVAAVWIYSHRKLYEPLIPDLKENVSLKDWCFKHVTPPRALVDHVQIVALATALKVPVTVERLTTGPGQDIYFGDGVPPVRVTLLFTGNHYDIIYPIAPSDRTRSQ